MDKRIAFWLASGAIILTYCHPCWVSEERGTGAAGACGQCTLGRWRCNPRATERQYSPGGHSGYGGN